MSPSGLTVCTYLSTVRGKERSVGAGYVLSGRSVKADMAFVGRGYIIGCYYFSDLEYTVYLASLYSTKDLLREFQVLICLINRDENLPSWIIVLV